VFKPSANESQAQRRSPRKIREFSGREQAIYLGREMVGLVVQLDREFTAMNAAGDFVGIYFTRQAATSAVLGRAGAPAKTERPSHFGRRA